MAISAKIPGFGENPPKSDLGDLYPEELDPILVGIEEKFPLPHILDDVLAAGRCSNIGEGFAHKAAVGEC